jgi:hypothetical protein
MFNMYKLDSDGMEVDLPFSLGALLSETRERFSASIYSNHHVAAQRRDVKPRVGVEVN